MSLKNGQLAANSKWLPVTCLSTCVQYTPVMSLRGAADSCVLQFPKFDPVLYTPVEMMVHLSLGSNLGHREATLHDAVRALGRTPGIQVTQVSSIFETEPVGFVEQPRFCNLAAEIETALEPLELLNAVKRIEVAIGRVPTHAWGPRLIDIDIVLWGDRIVSTDTLTIPHKEFRTRAFVLIPLCEIAPDAVDPETGKTITALAQSPSLQGHVERIS